MIVTVLWLVLHRENLGKAREREELGIEPILGDIGDSDGDFAGDGDPRWIFQT